jgi:hypothetical protein
MDIFKNAFLTSLGYTLGFVSVLQTTTFLQMLFSRREDSNPEPDSEHDVSEHDVSEHDYHSFDESRIKTLLGRLG